MIPQTPEAIQEQSFSIVEKLLAPYSFSPAVKQVVGRVVHATGDISWADELSFHPDALARGCAALGAGAPIVTDVQMVKAGINRSLLNRKGNRLFCGIRRRSVSDYARNEQITRAAAAVRLLAGQWKNGVLLVGNAPSALQEACRLIGAGKAAPALVIGVPVGFVGAAESKGFLRAAPVPWITNESRKGGSAVAVAILNALLGLSTRGYEPI